MVLPDVIIDDAASDLKDNLAKMVRNYKESSHSQIMVEPVEIKDVSKYGIVDCHSIDVNAGESATIFDVVEKPEQDDAPSNLVIVGRYVLTPEIWLHLYNQA